MTTNVDQPTTEIDQSDADVLRVRGMAAWAQMLDVIEMVEWVEGAYIERDRKYKYFGTRCPWCGSRPLWGHRPDCPRELAIARVRG